MSKKIKQNTLFDFIKNKYVDCFKSLNDIKYLILFSFSILFFSGVITYFLNPEWNLISQAIENVKDYADSLRDENFFNIFKFILLNNSRVSLLILALSFIPLFSLLITITNGAIIGKVLRMKIDQTNNFFTFIYLLPHGIFEIPAICISLALNLKFNLFLLGFLKINEKYSFLKKILYLLKEIFWIFLLIIFPLLFIAAFIETFLFLIWK